MSNLILFSQQDPSIPRVSVTLDLGLTDVQLTGVQKLARQAARGSVAAPVVDVSNQNLEVNVVGISSEVLQVPKANVISPASLCIVEVLRSSTRDAPEYVIVSGSLQIQSEGLDDALLKSLWPPEYADQFGKLDRLVITPVGLQIESELELENGTKVRRRFHLVNRMSVSHAAGQESRLVWRQIAWRDAGLATPSTTTSHEDPVHRLMQVEEESKKRLGLAANAPILHVNRWEEQTNYGGAVFVHVRIKDGAAIEAREQIVPGWALSIGGADWAPRSLVVKKSNFIYTDSVDAFSDDAFEESAVDQTSFEWSWDTSSTTTVLPLLKKLSSVSKLVSTGEVPGAGANLPYLWQRTRLEVGADTNKKIEPGVWMRYRLDSLPVRENAVSRQADDDAGLSRSIRLDAFKDENDAVEKWEIELSLLPIPAVSDTAARIWLALTPVQTSSPHQSVRLTMRNARIEAASPPFHTMQTALNDPASLPNQADRFAGLHANTRILLANDRKLPGDDETLVHALEAAQRDNKSRITLSTFGHSHDIIVACVPGPVAGIDLVPRVGGNLTPSAPTNPNSPPPLDRVRNYESGLVAVHLKSNITLKAASDEGLGTVSVNENTDLFPPAEEMVSALHPWSLVSVGKSRDEKFSQHQLQPLHHNALLEAFDWARSMSDRQDAEPGALPPLVDPGISDQPEDQPRDFRRGELQSTISNAVRDRFSKATTKPFLLTDGSPQPVANWLPGVKFKARTADEKDVDIVPQIKCEGSIPSAIQFDWEKLPDLPPLDSRKKSQSLKLTSAPRAFTATENSTTFKSKSYELSKGAAVRLLQTGAFPGGLKTNSIYYVVQVDKSAGTFELSTSKGGEAVSPTSSGEGEWQPIADDWLSAWLRWTAEDDDGSPAVHVDPDGQNGARQAKNSDIPLLEQRTPITAVAAGWLKGRMWIFFAIDAPTGNATDRLFAWEPLAGGIPEILPLTTLQKTRIDCLAIDASSSSLTLVVAEQSHFVVATYEVGDGVLGKKITEVRVNAVNQITAMKLAAQRVFIGTKDGFSVWKLDGTISTKVSTAPVKALDVRADVRTDGAASKMYLAVVTSSSSYPDEVTIYAWNITNQGISGDPTMGPNITGQNTPRLTVLDPNLTRICGVALQAADDRLFLYAVAASQNGESSQVVAWPAFKVPDSSVIQSFPPEKIPSDLRILGTALRQCSLLKLDPAFNDDADLDGGVPASRWMALASVPRLDGTVDLTTVSIAKWGSEEEGDSRPDFKNPTMAIGLTGNVVDLVMIPGRDFTSPMNPPEARFGAWVVTGGTDGTVRVWEPESGQEKFRHTQSSNKYLDALGVTRMKNISPSPAAPSQPGFWAEVISVPLVHDGITRKSILMLSTIGEPVDLLSDSTQPGSELRFLCQDLPLMATDGTKAWEPVPFNSSQGRYRHGVYGFCGKPAAESASKACRLFGLPIEVVQVTKVVFAQELGVTAGRRVDVTTMELDVILSNPAEMIPDGATVPIVDKELIGDKITSALVHLVIDVAGKKASLSKDKTSTFDWQFPLTDQLPPENQSVLPGRLAQLAGTVDLDQSNVLKLIPSLTRSRAEALGRLRGFKRLPSMVLDLSNGRNVRFREDKSKENKLELLGNPLPHPSGSDDVPITATEIGAGMAANSVALLGAQPGNGTEGSLQLSDLNSGLRLFNYTDRLKRARLVVDKKVRSQENTQRLTAIGVAEDGTIRVRQLFEFMKNDTDGKISFIPIPASLQEQASFALHTPAEEVQVFDDARDMRWLLTRCRDGSAWLTTTLDTEIRHNLSLPDTAITAIAFGPTLPEFEQMRKTPYGNWLAFFGSIDPNLIPINVDGSLRAVLAIGGADGRVLVYAVADKEPPKLMRSFATLIDPVRSISFAFEKPNNELPPGIFLMSCDGGRPMHLAELLSGTSPTVTVDGLDTKVAMHGELIYNENLHGIVQTQEGSTVAISAWTKKDGTGFETSSTTIGSPLMGQRMLPSYSTETGGFVIVNEEGWALYEFDDTQSTSTFKPSKALTSAKVVDLADESIFSNSLRLIVALHDSGVVDVWYKEASDTQWTQRTDTAGNLPMQVGHAVFGRSTLPIVPCRGMDGRPGSFHAVDLAASEWTWPEALGPLDADTPLALAGIGGVPHLAVARSGNLTVWNLATGRLIHRVGLSVAVAEIELGEDLGRSWLLVGSTDLWKTVELQSQQQTDILVADPTIKFHHARMFSFGKGLGVVAGRSDGTALTLRVTSPAAPNDVLWERTLTLALTSFEILDAVELQDTLWVLLRHSSNTVDENLSVLSLSNDSGSPGVVHPVGNGKPLAAAFERETEKGRRPSLWTIAKDGSQVARWTWDGQLSLIPEVQDEQRIIGLAAFRSLAGIRHDGREQLVALASNGLAVWDIEEKKLLRIEKLANPIARVSSVSVAAVVSVDSDAACVRFWDQSSGRLRQRLFTGDKLKSPNKIVAIHSPARPRLVISGTDKTVIVDVQSGLAVGVIESRLTFLTAIVASKNIVIAAIDASGDAGPKAKLWRTGLASFLEWEDFEPTLNGLPAPTSLALLTHVLPGANGLAEEPVILLAAARDEKLTVFKLSFSEPNLVVASALATKEPIIEAQTPIKSILLSTATQADCILVGVALEPSGNKGRVQLFDLPLKRNEDTEFNRPMTIWSNFELSHTDTTSLAVASTMDGPYVIANTEALRVSFLLRITAGQPPICALPVQLLLSEDEAFLSGRITPSRRLDLDIAMTANPETLGLPKDVKKLTARAALIQGPYSCFLIDSIDRNNFRLAGIMVLWGDSKASSDVMHGVFLLEDSYPTNPDKPADDTLGATATLSITKASNGNVTHDVILRGPRTRMRVMPFNAASKGMESLQWRETLSWYLADLNGGVELHLSDLLLDTHAPSTGDFAIVRAVISEKDKLKIQGDLLVTAKRNVKANIESYTFTLGQTAYGALAATEPDPSDFGTTRDDVVYPAIPNGPIGRAFDLVEPRPVEREAVDLSDETEKRHLVTLVFDDTDNAVKLKKIKPVGFAYDPNVGTGVTQALPLQPIDVPQLEHREAHGARIRARWSSALKEVAAGETDGFLEVSNGKLWLLSPLARTPRGVIALTLNLLIRPQGRALNWTRLLTESILTIHRDGSKLFGDTNILSSDRVRGYPTVRNILTSTILQSSGAAGSEEMPVLFDDVRIQTHALRTGLAGVLLARTRDARGRVRYRFVNSPYHSLVPITAKRPEPQILNIENDELEDSDPRLLPPAVVYLMKTHGSPRYYPAYSSHNRAALRGFERTPMTEMFPEVRDSREVLKFLPAIRIAETPALRGAEKPARPLVAGVSEKSGTPFVPKSFELGFGVDKPGAAFHQIVQCVGTTKDDDLMTHSALPTTYLRRDPQRFTPPTRAGLQIEDQTSIQRGKHKIAAKVAWTETLSVVPLVKSGFSERLNIKPGATSNEFAIENVEKCLRWFVRIGEQITEIDGELPVPLTALAEKHPIEAFDLFIVTRIAGLGEGTKLPDGSVTPELTPFVVAIEGTGDTAVYKSVQATKVFQNIAKGTFEIWRLTRAGDKPASIPILLKELVTEGRRLNLVWWKKDAPIDGDVYKKSPKLLVAGSELKLRNVPYQPQSPRVIAVLRNLEGSGSGLLSNTRELTLLDGPSASSNGVIATLQSAESDYPWIRFDAADAETLILADPYAADTQSPTSDLHLVKVFDDGATLETHQKIKIQT